MRAIKKLIKNLEETTPETFTLERKEVLLKQAKEVHCWVKVLLKMIDIKIVKELMERKKKSEKKKIAYELAHAGFFYLDSSINLYKSRTGVPSAPGARYSPAMEVMRGAMSICAHFRSFSPRALPLIN